MKHTCTCYAVIERDGKFYCSSYNHTKQPPETYSDKVDADWVAELVGGKTVKVTYTLEEIQ